MKRNPRKTCGDAIRLNLAEEFLDSRQLPRSYFLERRFGIVWVWDHPRVVDFSHL